MEDFKKNNSLVFFLIAVLAVIFDQLTKHLIKNYFQSVQIIKNFLSINYSQNTGAAFGILKDANILFISISIITILAIIYYYQKIISEKNKLLPISVSLILSGAIGNLFDRIFLGYVVDFIEFSFWPSFNIADSCLTIGVILLIYFFIKFKK